MFFKKDLTIKYNKFKDETEIDGEKVEGNLLASVKREFEWNGRLYFIIHHTDGNMMEEAYAIDETTYYDRMKDNESDEYHNRVMDEYFSNDGEER